MKTICTANEHDRGLDLILGGEIHGAVIGRISWDTFEDNPGYILRIGADEWAPDATEDVVEVLARVGYELDSVSLEEVSGLSAP